MIKTIPLSARVRTCMSYKSRPTLSKAKSNKPKHSSLRWVAYGALRSSLMKNSVSSTSRKTSKSMEKKIQLHKLSWRGCGKARIGTFML